MLNQIPHHRSHRRRVLSLTAAVVAGVVGSSIAMATGPSDAHALIASSEGAGLEVREPDAILDKLSLSIVQREGRSQYRLEMPEFGGRGLTAGRGCRVDPDNKRQGVNIVFCDRDVPKVRISLGQFDDELIVDPSFPDEMDVFGGIGRDQINLGAANDKADGGGDGDGIQGNGGDDILRGGNGNDGLRGGPGNDQLLGGGGFDTIDGGEGDDLLGLAPEPGSEPPAGTLTGGLGTDTFDAGGSQSAMIDARDGVRESVRCGTFPRSTSFFARLRRRQFTRAIVDLADQPAGGVLSGGGCGVLNRAPAGETTAVELTSSTLKLRGGRVALRVRCADGAACAGTATVGLGSGTAGKASYRVAGGRTASVPVTLSERAVRKVGRKPAAAQVQLGEKGIAGPRSERVTAAIVP